jgi:hypothetical protein
MERLRYILILFLGFFSMSYASEMPDFIDTLAIDYRSREHLDKYWLPADHPLKGWMDVLFSQIGITDNVQTLQEAGFKIISAMPFHPVIAKHSSAQGYIFKIYPDSFKYTREGISSAEWLVRRCKIAEKIRNIIREKGIDYFVVPDKWLYALPAAKNHSLILVAKDMDIEDINVSKIAWKTKVTPKHLDELYSVLSKGYGSVDLPTNIPYTKSGYFTFIDTENLKRQLNLRRMKKHFSKEMSRYWEKIID